MPDEKRDPQQQPERPGQQREEQEHQVPQRNPDVEIEEEEQQRDPSRRDDIDIDEDEDMLTGEQPPLEPEEP